MITVARRNGAEVNQNAYPALLSAINRVLSILVKAILLPPFPSMEEFVQPRPTSSLLSRIKYLAAPLLVLSVGIHGVLLVLPLPPKSKPEPPKEEKKKDDFVDLLSIGKVAPPQAKPPQAQPQTALPPPPKPVATATSLPRMVIPGPKPPVTPPPQAAAPSQAGPAPAADAQAAQAGQSQQAIDLANSLSRGSGQSDYDITATAFPAQAYSVPHGIKDWSAQQQACFFTQVSPTAYALRPGIANLRYLSRNVELIQSQDLPRSFSGFQIDSIGGGYCNSPLFQVSQPGSPPLFVSIVGIGVGSVGHQATGLVILWATDPRAS